MKKSFENCYATYSLVDNILCVYYKKDQLITLPAAKKIVSDRLRLQDHISLPVLCNISDFQYANYAARNYLAHTGSLLTQAVAIVCADIEQRSMSTYFIDVCVPSVPTRVFLDEPSAFHFLNNYKKMRL